MNYTTHTIGNSLPVINQFGSENSIVRPEKLLDILCFNSTAGLLYLQVFEITNSLIPFGTPFAGGMYTLNGLTIGHTYSYNMPNNGVFQDTNITNGAQLITYATTGYSGTFVAQGTSVTITGFAAVQIGTQIIDLKVPNTASVPVTGSTPKFSFPVQSGLGGTLGRQLDMAGIFCAWSSTAVTFTPTVAAGGAINIVLKA